MMAFLWAMAYCSGSVLGDTHDHSGHGPSPPKAVAEQKMDHTLSGDENGGHDHEKMEMSAQAMNADLAGQVRVDEKLDDFIDFAVEFRDEKNQIVDLESVFDKPVILLPIFFMCPSVCNILQANLSHALNQVPGSVGKEFNVISLSFSDDEDASHARTSKQNYANLITRDMDLDHWYYLTSNRENILKLTQSLGFYFVKQGKHNYIHPNVLIVLAKKGKIIRYLYGPNFLPFDVGMALSEAGKGESGISIKQGVLSFCFDYDAENKTYVFKMFRITGTAILILLIGFLLFLVRPSKYRSKRGRQHK
ncbi:MAG: SCO family protein [Desulfobacter sp.]|nr:SCO family protein [Desulfobacter sp.]WDP88129.1 MAG: SCO family protein [Desulfobacter sp.]